MIGLNVRHGPHQGAHRSTMTTLCIERSTTSVWNVASVTSTAMQSTLSAALRPGTCTLQRVTDGLERGDGGTDASLRWLVPIPELHQPTLVAVLSGWIDAGGAARAAAEAIEDDAATSPIAEFDDDVYVDYRARRPIMELRDGLNSVLNWERITLTRGRDQTGHDVLLLTGPEPDMAWHRFTRTVADLASRLGVRQFAHLGAYPFATPHTRPARISVTSPSQDMLMRVPYLRSSIDVPAGAAAALEHEMHDRGIPAIGIWAQVPHDLAAMTYTSAQVAVL